MAGDSFDTRLKGLSATVDGNRLFAVDNNKAIKCVDLRTLVVHNAYKSDREVLAVQVLAHSSQKVCSSRSFTIITV